MNACHIYAPVGDYECSLSPSDSGPAGNDLAPRGDVPNAAPDPEFFERNTATARLALAMPFVLGFLIAAILVAGYVWRF